MKQDRHTYLFIIVILLVHFQLVGGGTFDLKQNFLIREPAAVLLILELLPSLSEDIQVG